ncbi:MAG: 4Fe-4S cluster-binding domain-containing protein [Lachnospiraceae bacterium]
MERRKRSWRQRDPGCGRVPVNKIIPFSAVDGPGNRTAVFLQGCNFDCRYCHNPETRNLCRNCGSCVGKCPKGALFTDEDGKVRFCPEKCCGCDTCIHVCPFGCSPRIRMMCAEEVFAEVKKQQPYIRGITVSGGECTLYPDFLEKLLSWQGEPVLEPLSTATEPWILRSIRSFLP